MLKQIHSVEEFEQLTQKEDKLLILKHSSTCPVSHAAYDEYEKFANSNPDKTAYYLVVQDSRPLSNHIAEKFEVKHESPQAILLSNSEVEWHASHWKITSKTLGNAMLAQK